MLPPLVSQGDVVVPCKSELSVWRPLARVRGHGLVVKAIYTWSGPCNSAARYKQTKLLHRLHDAFNSNASFWWHKKWRDKTDTKTNDSSNFVPSFFPSQLSLVLVLALSLHFLCHLNRAVRICLTSVLRKTVWSLCSKESNYLFSKHLRTI